MFGSAFKTRKPRQFDYHPRFYDPDKEAWEERKKEVLGERYYENHEKTSDCKPGQRVRDLRIRRGVVANRQRAQQKRSLTTRMIILILILAALVWFIFSI